MVDVQHIRFRGSCYTPQFMSVKTKYACVCACVLPSIQIAKCVPYTPRQ